SKNRLVTLAYGGGAAALVSITIALLLKPLDGVLYVGDKPDMVAIGVSSLADPYYMSDAKYIWGGADCVLSGNDEVGKIISVENCTLGDFHNAEKRVLVIGNSFSAAFVQAFDELVEKDGFAITVTSSWGASQ